MTKNNKKSTHSISLYDSFVIEFDKWSEKAAGLKGEKLSGGIMALMGLHAIDESLAFALMDCSMTQAKAKELILRAVREKIYAEAFADLTAKQKEQLLRDAEQSKRNLDENK